VTGVIHSPLTPVTHIMAEQDLQILNPRTVRLEVFVSESVC
jgi:hypothetical protein